MIELEPTVRIPVTTALLETNKSPDIVASFVTDKSPPVTLIPDLAVTSPIASTLLTSS